MHAKLEPLSVQAQALKPGIYRHFKGNLYHLIEIGRHRETLEEMVVYRDQDQTLWIRPLTIFCENIHLKDGQKVPRFAFVGEA